MNTPTNHQIFQALHMRMVKLQALAQMVNDEATQISTALGALLQATPPPSVASAADGLSDEDRQRMMADVDNAAPASQVETATQATPVQNTIRELGGHVFSSVEILSPYLDKTVFVGGRGNVSPANGVLKQYEQDAYYTEPEVLHTWPVGFYRNAKTGQEQLFLRGMDHDSMMVCIDGLPGCEGKVVIHQWIGERWVRSLVTPESRNFFVDMVQASTQAEAFINEQLKLWSAAIIQAA